MGRVGVLCLCLVGCRWPWPPPYDLDIAGPCGNPYLPIALGNHWEYDVSTPTGSPIGSTIVDVVAVDAQAGRATLRSIATRAGKPAAPASVPVACTGGGAATPPP